MRLFYINKHDSRCFSPADGINLAYLAAPLLLFALPLLAVVLSLTF
jgi:hypothetical protein